MKRGKLTSGCLAAALLLLLPALTAGAQPGTKKRPDQTVFLYRKAPVALSDEIQGRKMEALGLEMTESNGLAGEERINSSGDMYNISEDARFDLYFPKKGNGRMLVVCPGGGYRFVSSYNEGLFVADRLTREGFTIAVVKYRLPAGHWEVPLSDVQQVFRYCRRHAGEWGVRQIGVIGFSAGGHLACSATTLFTDAETRPDFSVLVYPVIDMDDRYTHAGTKEELLGKAEKWTSTTGKTADGWIADNKLYKSLLEKYSLQNGVTAALPPVFIAHCTDDGAVPVHNSLAFYNRLVECGVSCEMHLFPKGGHGWGFTTAEFGRKDRIPEFRAEFETALLRWLNAR